MDTIIASAAAELIKNGLAGLFILYLLWVNKQYREANDAKTKRIDELQEARVREAAETVRTLGTMSISNDKIAEALEGLADQQENLRERLEKRRA